MPNVAPTSSSIAATENDGIAPPSWINLMSPPSTSASVNVRTATEGSTAAVFTNLPFVTLLSWIWTFIDPSSTSLTPSITDVSVTSPPSVTNNEGDVTVGASLEDPREDTETMESSLLSEGSPTNQIVSTSVSVSVPVASLVSVSTPDEAVMVKSDWAPGYTTVSSPAPPSIIFDFGLPIRVSEPVPPIKFSISTPSGIITL